MCKGDWPWQQYLKIQDFVVKHRLYRYKKSDVSHADILIGEVEHLKARLATALTEIHRLKGLKERR